MSPALAGGFFFFFFLSYFILFIFYFLAGRFFTREAPMFNIHSFVRCYSLITDALWGTERYVGSKKNCIFSGSQRDERCGEYCQKRELAHSHLTRHRCGQKAEGKKLRNSPES